MTEAGSGNTLRARPPKLPPFGAQISAPDFPVTCLRAHDTALMREQRIVEAGTRREREGSRVEGSAFTSHINFANTQLPSPVTPNTQFVNAARFSSTGHPRSPCCESPEIAFPPVTRERHPRDCRTRPVSLVPHRHHAAFILSTTSVEVEVEVATPTPTCWTPTSTCWTPTSTFWTRAYLHAQHVDLGITRACFSLRQTTAGTRLTPTLGRRGRVTTWAAQATNNKSPSPQASLARAIAVSDTPGQFDIRSRGTYVAELERGERTRRSGHASDLAGLRRRQRSLSTSAPAQVVHPGPGRPPSRTSPVAFPFTPSTPKTPSDGLSGGDIGYPRGSSRGLLPSAMMATEGVSRGGGALYGCCRTAASSTGLLMMMLSTPSTLTAALAAKRSVHAFCLCLSAKTRRWSVLPAGGGGGGGEQRHKGADEGEGGGGRETVAVADMGTLVRRSVVEFVQRIVESPLSDE
ncbi:hypothetical protein BD626DRAFT_571257 [Schizophyllum amplum]|uniref:Uncharacterized protein n=1 Tax=Schizophyllum amplum TaxID=97359 RepID=A0A550C7U1_9AGAR|nr:hypothetical protein BD626DRAFT_571257 [Auriculariopsis ampla]